MAQIRSAAPTEKHAAYAKAIAEKPDASDDTKRKWYRALLGKSSA